MSNRPLPFTAERLLRILTALPPANSYLVGFSGGADSTALLHAMSTLGDKLNTRYSAVHVNHGLHADCDQWQTHCENFCRQHGIGLVSLDINVDASSGKGVEAEARHLRYQAIEALLKPGDSLLTGHHADDQAETLLLNLMRGSGVDGLSAMPEHRPLGTGVLQRPMLAFHNRVLKDYLRENGVEWLDDPSNLELNFDRNFVRHTVMPLLESRWPGLKKRLLLTRKAMADARCLLEQTADDYLGRHLLHPLVLRITPRLGLEAALFNLVLRRWLRKSMAPSIPAYSMGNLAKQVGQAKSGHKITVSWGGWRLHHYKQCLWLQTDREIDPCPCVAWPDDHNEIDLGQDVGQLALQGATGARPHGKFSVSNRTISDANTIKQDVHHKSLKNLFQEAGIPPWLRDSVPLCSLDGEPVALGDWCFNHVFASWMQDNRVMLRWLPRNPLLQYIRSQHHPREVDPAGVVR